jgi:hypothetical protein
MRMIEDHSRNRMGETLATASAIAVIEFCGEKRALDSTPGACPPFFFHPEPQSLSPRT